MYKRILVPLNGSLLTEQALPHAVSLAEHFNVELFLLKVLKHLGEGLNMPLGALKKSRRSFF
ncbi:MAG: universal stress protein [Chloroflexota bacterium]